MKKTIKWIVIIFIVLMVIGLIVGNDDKGTNSADTDVHSESADDTSEVVEAIPVTASELLKAYESNEMAADKQYKGKTLEVTGIVTGIDSGFSDNAIINLGSGDAMEFLTVSAEGDEAFDEAAINLTKGQELTTTCKSTGEVMGMPTLEKCVIK